MSGARRQDELGHLVDMANDIARNFSFHADGAARIADHLRRFWAPSMRNTLSAHVAAGGSGLADSAIEAVKSLQG